MIQLITLFETSNNDFKVYEVKYDDIKEQLKEIHDIPHPTKDELNASHYFIIKRPEDKFFAGIIVMNTSPREEYNLLGGLNKKELGHDIELLFFFVYDKYRHMGLGTRLLSYVLNKYRNKYIGLGTGKRSSDQAKKLYSKFGFKVVVDVPPFNWWLRHPTH